MIEPDGKEQRRDAQVVVALRRRLTEAIDALPEIYRTTLVLRYLDEKQPQEIAALLDLPVTTVRKRVSRGLGLLREELDREYGDREAWSLAVAGLWLGRDGASSATVKSAPGPSAALATGAPASTLGPWIVAAMALAVLGIAAWQVGGPGNQVAPLPAELEGPADSATPAQTSVALGPLEGGVAHQREAELGDDHPGDAPFVPLRIVDPEGLAVAASQVAWIDESGRVHGLRLRDGRAVAPKGHAEGGVYVARAEGYAPAGARVERHQAVTTLVLERPLTVAGRLSVGGRAPSESQPLYLDLRYRHLHLARNVTARRHQVQALRDLGVLDELPCAWTDEAGRFAFQGAHPNEEVRVLLPDSYRVPANGDRAATAFGLPGVDRIVHATRVPFIVGQAVWRDDGTPVEGDVMLERAYRGLGYSGLDRTRVQAGGHFEIGFPASDATRPELGSRHSVVRFTIDADRGDALAVEHVVAVPAPHEAPRNLGTIQVDRAEPEGWPIEEGHSFSVDARVESEWEGAKSFAGDQLRARTNLRVEYKGHFFPGLSPKEQQVKLSAAVGQHRWVRGEGGEICGFETPLRGGPVRLTGVASGLPIDVSLTDIAGGVLVTERWMTAHGEQDFEGVLALPTGAAGHVSLRVEDEWGRPVDGARLALNGQALEFGTSQGQAQLGPLARQSYVLEIRADGHPAVALEFDHDGTQRRLSATLATARTLKVHFVDDSGRGVRPDAAVLAWGGASQTTSEARLSGATASFGDAPFEPCELRVRVGTVVHRRSLGENERERTVVLPQAGTLRVQLPVEPTARRSGCAAWLFVRELDARPLPPRGRLEAIRALDPWAAGTAKARLELDVPMHRVSPVLHLTALLSPGTYEVLVVRGHRDDPDGHVLLEANVNVLAHSVTTVVADR